MSQYISNYKTSKRTQKERKATRPVQIATRSSSMPFSDGQASTPAEHTMPTQIQATRKQAGKRGGAFFLSLVVHLVGALIATAYVVQEKMVNEEMMQGVLLKPAPKPDTQAPVPSTRRQNYHSSKSNCNT